jgi:NADH-quinone oxidoreductase subunit N
VIAAGASSAIWLLVFVLIVSSVFGLYYYLRIVVTMYSGLHEEAGVSTSRLGPALSASGGFVLAVLTILLVWVGVYPATLLQIIHSAVAKTF